MTSEQIKNLENHFQSHGDKPQPLCAVRMSDGRVLEGHMMGLDTDKRGVYFSGLGMNCLSGEPYGYIVYFSDIDSYEWLEAFEQMKKQ